MIAWLHLGRFTPHNVESQRQPDPTMKLFIAQFGPFLDWQFAAHSIRSTSLLSREHIFPTSFFRHDAKNQPG